MTDLSNVRWPFIRQAMIGWLQCLDHIKTKGATNVLVGNAVTFLLTCERFGVRPQRVLEVAGRVISDKRARDPQYIRGTEEWLRNELRDDG